MKCSPSLVLYPVDVEAQLDTVQLTAALTAWGLAGEPLAPSCYAGGAALWDFVCLLGCAPVWQQTPTLTLHTAPLAYFWHSAYAPLPRCPKCQVRQEQAVMASLAALPGLAPLWECGCGYRAAALHWRWGRYAVYARSWLAISPVYPGEAVPTEVCLAQLADVSGLRWDYAYCGGAAP
jgi:hypothetical protein